MSYPFPTRTLSSTLADHLDDHNTIATILGETPFTANSTRDEHLAEHNALHPAFGLPTRALGDSATFHLNDHATIHTNLIQTYAGIRGNWGQQLNTTDVPGWPVAFTSSHSTFLSLQTAVNAAGTGRVFRITNSMTFTASLTPHTNDQFWFDPGVIITGTALTIPAFTDGSVNRTSVKFMNGSFTGFRSTLSFTATGGFEAAYCNFTNENTGGLDSQGSIHIGANPATPVAYVHHNKFHATGNPFHLYQNHTGARIEDNEFTGITPTGASGAFKLATDAFYIQFGHNWIHDITGATDRGLWLDFWLAGCVIEWNMFDTVGVGIEIEACPGTLGLSDLGSNPPWIGNHPTDITTKIRRNYVRNCRHGALFIAGSSECEIYENYLYRNQTAQQVGIESEIELLETDQHFRAIGNGDGQGTDTRNNSIHNNYVEIQPTIAGHQPKRGGGLQVITGTALTDVTPWTSNAKNNRWDNNSYVLNRAVGSADTFYWQGNKSWAQWQALPQDANSGAA